MKKEQQALLKHGLFFLGFFLFSFLWGRFFFLSTFENPYDLLSSSDQALFEYFGKAWIIGGKLPYVNYFDHKGPFIFLWYGIGYLFGGRNGVFLLSVLWTSASCFLAYLCLKEHKTEEKWYEIFSVLLSLFIPFLYRTIIITCGITVGWVSEPFLFACLLILLKQRNEVPDKRRRALQNFLYGVCCMIPILSRATDSVFVFLAWTLVRLFQLPGKRNKKEIFQEMGQAVLGGLLPFIIFATYFAANGALFEFMDATFFANLRYLGGSSVSKTDLITKNVIFLRNTFMFPCLYGGILLDLFCVRIKAIGRENLTKREIKKNLPYFLALLCQMIVFVNSFGYDHYITPILVTFPFFFVIASEGISIKKNKFIKTVLLIFPLVFGLYALYFFSGEEVTERLERQSLLKGKISIERTLAREIAESGEDYVCFDVTSSDLLLMLLDENARFQESRFVTFQTWYARTGAITKEDLVSDMEEARPPKIYFVYSEWVNLTEIFVNYEQSDFLSFGFDEKPDFGIYVFERKQE